MDFDDLGLAAAKQTSEPACTIAPHRIDHHGQTSIFDGL